MASSTSNSVTPGPFKRLAQHERQFHFHARRDEAIRANVLAAFDEHAVEQRRVVGLVDLRRTLHRARGQADLAALDHVAFGEFELHPLALNRVAVLYGHLGILGGEVAQLGARFLGVVELRREVADSLFV